MNTTTKTLTIGGALLAALLVTTVQCASHADATRRAAGENAFATVYAVLQHPRCRNCHPAGRVPLQGDDGRPHGQNVQGGDDGLGLFAMRCANCHFAQNGAGPNLPPGAPGWHLPKGDMPLVFQGRTPAQLAAQLADRAQNGGRSLDDVLHHVTSDPLVLWGWNPGPGRAPVPLPHAEFVAAMRTWIDAGCPLPE